MKVIPAIDLMNGKVVRLIRGDPKTLKVYKHFGDPITVARKWESEGVDAIHIIDLDAALNRGSNLQEIERISQVIKTPLQVGGGIRTLTKAQNLLSRKVDRIIVGALAFNETTTLTKLLKDFGSKRVIVALDHMHGKVMVRGWREATKLGVEEAMLKFLSLGVKLFLITSITKDGTLTGPDYKTLGKASSNPGVCIIAAGGVSSLEDLIGLKQTGVWGVVIGKALYEGVLNLKEALRVGREGEN